MALALRKKSVKSYRWFPFRSGLSDDRLIEASQSNMSCSASEVGKIVNAGLWLVQDCQGQIMGQNV